MMEASTRRSHLPNLAEAIVESSDDAIVSKTLEGTVLTWNTGAERMYGYRDDEVIGRSIDLIVPAERLGELTEILARIQDGQHVEAFETVRLRKDGTRVEVLLTVSPILDESGRAIAASAIGRDIGQRLRVERNHRFLSEASRLLGKSLTTRRTLARLARLTIDYVADWFIIDLVTQDGKIERAAVAAANPRKKAPLEEMKRLYVPDLRSPQPAARALRSGKPVLFKEFTEQSLAATAKDERHLALLQELDPRSAIAVPLVSRRRTLGALTFASSESGRLYDRTDVSLAEELAVRAALAIDNARLFEERSHIARTLQRSLLPPRLPEVEGLELHASYHAAGTGHEVGGDFFDVFELQRRRLMLYVGDVCGRGTDAAALSGLARHTIRAGAVRSRQPRSVLRLLNEILLAEHPARNFCTVALAHVALQQSGAAVTLAAGGHPPPVLVRRRTGAAEALDCPGPLIGIFEEAEFRERKLELEPGDLLCLYTDGVTERRHGSELFGEDRLRELLEETAGLELSDIARRIESELQDFDPGPPADDSVVLLARLSPAPAR